MARSKEFEEIEVLDKAVDLFWDQGFNATSIQEVVEHLGISRSSLYDTFGDKRTLFIKALERYRVKVAQGIIDRLNAAQEVLPVVQSILFAAEAPEELAHVGCFVVNASTELAPHDAEVYQLVTQTRLDIEAALARAVERGQASGEVSRQHPAKATAGLLYTTLMGLRVADRGRYGAPAQAEVVNLLVAMLRA
ncbi:MAG: TetR/AcrR family transcriptional regulator [Bernardetiaceae bacterium]|nr:TetR/AcrR family transcriptional regulator [Bernardetiaceae bacterium]